MSDTSEQSAASCDAGEQQLKVTQLSHAYWLLLLIPTLSPRAICERRPHLYGDLRVAVRDLPRARYLYLALAPIR